MGVIEAVPRWMTYADLADRLKQRGLPDESETTIKAKLKRGTFAATFLLATIAAREEEWVGRSRRTSNPGGGIYRVP